MLINWSKGYPVDIKEGIATRPAVQMVVSAGRLFPWQAWYLARTFAHSFPAVPA